MKLLTINTHSLHEENYPRKLEEFIDVIAKERPDIVAMQEVNQTADAPLAGKPLLVGYVPCKENDILVREDNHAAQAAFRFHFAGLPCFWTWVPAKIGYGKYDEGMAIFSFNKKITEIDSFYISKIQDYQNWKTRKVLGIRTEGDDNWYYTVHMGWWQDSEEPFQYQWEQFSSVLNEKRKDSTVWLMGDFNSPAEVRNQGYDCITHSFWYDTYLLAEEKDSGFTVEGVIDGWREFIEDPDSAAGMRIDHIWCSEPKQIRSSKVMFNRKNGPIISDHFGVMIEIPKILHQEVATHE